MQTSERLNGTIVQQYWDLGPLWAGVAALLIVWAAMFLIAAAFNGRFQLSQWNSFNWGDAIGVPIMVGFMARSLRDFGGSSRFYVDTAWYVAWGVIAILVIVYLAFADYSQRGTFYYLVNTPQAVYHQVMMLVAIWTIGSASAASLVADSPLWVRIGIIVGFLIYLGSLACDQLLVARGLRPIPGVNY